MKEYVIFYIYNNGTAGKLIKTYDEKFSRLNTGLILNVSLFNHMSRIQRICDAEGYEAIFKTGV